MWSLDTHGNPFKEVSVYIIRGDYRKVVAFSFLKENLPHDLMPKAELINVKAISLHYFIKNNA